jgi:GalNAc-alpha-(1->4)-GalNAc-alpha-(1->3)-diNAcBac-PP-undecaprenol alpha-1,4-N-acetyl-D-galactosaminyltransferase
MGSCNPSNCGLNWSMKATSPQNNVALIVASLNSGGTERVASTMANYWSENGANVVIVMLNHGQGVFYPIRPEISIERLSYCKHTHKLKQIIGFFSTVVRLRKVLAEYHVETQVSFLPHVNIIAILASLGSARRVVVSERNDMTRQALSRQWRALRYVLYRVADLVTVNYRKNIKILGQFVPAGRIRWLPNPVDVAAYTRINRCPSRRILAVGRLTRQKGFDILIQAFELTECKDKGWTLEIIGKGTEETELRRMISGAGLMAQITMKESSKRISEDLARTEMLVVPSRYEGLPNILIEGMACGIPPIVTDGVGDLVMDLSLISKEIIVPVGSSNALARAIDHLALSSSERQRVGREAIKITKPYELDRAMRLWSEAVRV